AARSGKLGEGVRPPSGRTDGSCSRAPSRHTPRWPYLPPRRSNICSLESAKAGPHGLTAPATALLHSKETDRWKPEAPIAIIDPNRRAAHRARRRGLSRLAYLATQHNCSSGRGRRGLGPGGGSWLDFVRCLGASALRIAMRRDDGDVHE